MSESLVLVETHGKVGVITLNRPKALNALNNALVAELATEVRKLEADPAISVMILTGSEKAFAAGVDIEAMKDWSYSDVYNDDYLGGDWQYLRRLRKPLIAAVAGYALGGGCELAMLCDIIIAAENARFGQPEIKLGIMPGYGGTQHLTRAVGRAKAMDLILTARTIKAEEADAIGLVSRVVPTEKLMEEAMDTAQTIAAMSLPSVMMAKESINRAYESGLAEGLIFERRNFHALFATEDQKEGMAAFVEKRQPNFKNK